MLRLTTAFLITLACGLLQFHTCQANDTTRTRESEFRLAVRLVREAPESTRLDDVLLYKVLTSIGTARETPESPNDSIRAFLDGLVDDPMNHPNIRRAALWSLRIFEPDQELEHMRDFLDDPDLQLTAAEILVKWGYWDEGSPLLVENEMFGHLVLYDPSKAEPIVREAVVSASPEGRINAASLLSQYGDSLRKIHVARELIQELVISGEQYPDTMNIRRALRTAHRILREQHDPNDLPLLEAGLSHFSRSVRTTAFTAIWAWAWEGDSRAISVIRSAAESNRYAQIRERARDMLEILDHRD